jgi:hypothetical protein
MDHALVFKSLPMKFFNIQLDQESEFADRPRWRQCSGFQGYQFFHAQLVQLTLYFTFRHVGFRCYEHHPDVMKAPSKADTYRQFLHPL